jgi:hypothetical protein
MRDTYPRPSIASSFYVPIVTSSLGPYAIEWDYVDCDPVEQWKQLVEDVRSGEIENVIACYRVHPANGTCEDQLVALAKAVDYRCAELTEDPFDDLRDWIELHTGDQAFETEAHRRQRIEEQRIDYTIDLARGK